MKKVYVIGAGSGSEAIEKARRILDINGDIEIICVEDMEDIPLKEQLSSDPSVIQQIYEFKSCPILPYESFESKKMKGHERPYKYHR